MVLWTYSNGNAVYQAQRILPGKGALTKLDLNSLKNIQSFLLGVFLKKNYSDAQVYINNFPTGAGGTLSLELNKKMASISSNIMHQVSTSDVLFVVKKNGSKNGQDFEVLGDGSVNASALTIPSSTANSTKKFKITVDDTGTISATEVT